jgi:hypothetical protein
MEQAYAVVVGGKVANVVVWDGVSDWKPSEGEVVPLTDNAGIDWDYADGVFTDNRPEPES